MLKLFLSLLVVAFPSAALAHPGHEHFGSASTHHLFEYAAVVVPAAMLLWYARHRVKGTSRDR